eukprot:CAMPEP_0182559748 /NCGR_PEP_ID=MMETSP1324-20130603/2756_1 /TAXON_ID=236786 /ORGANISM="Florenciella sp., Strain RCC1587" /LENGTH=81 /DNA_ID=CAMNT_0024772047 /DNA_START=156 /DNA_END=401 /DNA_ORIENTATION=+
MAAPPIPPVSVTAPPGRRALAVLACLLAAAPRSPQGLAQGTRHVHHGLNGAPSVSSASASNSTSVCPSGSSSLNPSWCALS